jgi:hypothetical protein
MVTVNDDADHRPDVYVEGDKVVYRASAIGGCLRSLVACRLGYTPLPFDDASERRMAEGNLHEPAILRHLAQEGWVVVDHQKEVELTIGDTLVIRGHIDGVGANGVREQVRVVEAKAMGKDPFKEWAARKFDSNPRYAWQVSTYMHGLGFPGLFAVKNRDTGEVMVDLLDEAPIPLTHIKARVARIEAIARRGDLPDCDVTSTWNCPFRYLHDQRPVDMTVVEDDEVDALAVAYDRARAMATQADAMKKLARDRLVGVVRDRGKVRTGQWSVSCTLSTRKTVDMAKLKAEVDVSPYEVTSEVEQLRVNAVRG